MVYENSLPDIRKGITVLFDANDSIKTLVCNCRFVKHMLHRCQIIF